MDKTNNALSTKKIKYITKIFPTKRNQDSDGFSGEFYQIFKENTIPIFYNLILWVQVIFEAQLPWH